ncbi:hypothetical protein [Kordia sp.]|uniref:hypothetical protein n=1 Tax=Kordia sp. TaxID=1965332 RepID=UPI0025C4C170|nr:hypothetical protein [Kordia sp.]MCH2194398.1 hypothetical protein [Kordia sp.]
MSNNHHYAMNGFFSRLWKGIKRIAGTIIGGLLGGPIGLLVGAAIDHLLNQPQIVEDPLWDGSGVINGGSQNLAQRATGLNPVVEFPLTQQEETLFFDYFEYDFLPTIRDLANMVDSEINVNFLNKNLQLQSGNKVTNIANEVLKAIATFRSYNTLIENIGEPRKTENYVANKVYFTGKFLSILEKSVLQYVEANKVNQLSLISVDYNFQTVTKLKSSTINWQGHTVTGKLKKYVDITFPPEPTDVNPLPVVVTDTDPTNLNDATDESQDILVIPEKDNKLLKTGLVFVAGVLVSKIINN